MSHFTVLIIGDNWEEQLKPFQENNMGDVPDEYLDFVDTEDDKLKEYQEDSREMVRMKDGTLKCPYDECFRVPGSFGTSFSGGAGCTSHVPPADLERVNIRFRELYPTFEEFMNDWCGDEERDPKTGRYGYWRNESKWVFLDGDGNEVEPPTPAMIEQPREVEVSESTELQPTTPNLPSVRNPGLHISKALVKGSKWDWYQVGGRWTGFFKLRPNREGAIGEPGLMTPLPPEDYVDQAKKGDIDFEAMRQEHVAKRLARYRKFHGIVSGRPIPNWAEIRERHADNMDAAHEEYRNDPVVKDLHLGRGEDSFVFDNLRNYDMPEKEFAMREYRRAISTFAVLKDGKWYERGEMGWWACVSDEKEGEIWDEEFNRLLYKVSDDTLLTIVDCHI